MDGAFSAVSLVMMSTTCGSVDAAIAFRLALKNELRGTAKAGREFDDVLAFQLGFRQHAPGQLLAARAQNALTDAGEQPVSLQMLHITI